MSQSAQRPGRPTSHAQVHCIYHTSRNPGKEMTMGENASSGAQNSRPSNSSTGSEQHCDGNRIDSTGLKFVFGIHVKSVCHKHAIVCKCSKYVALKIQIP